MSKIALLAVLRFVVWLVLMLGDVDLKMKLLDVGLSNI